MQTNLYKCFLPIGWKIANSKGISGFLHPEGVYDDPKGGKLRSEIYLVIMKRGRLRSFIEWFLEL